MSARARPRPASGARFAAFVLAVAAASTLAAAPDASGQTVTQRGFAEGVGYFFPEVAPNDATRVVGDAVVREEVFFKPTPWLQFAGGLDLRGNTHDQVEPVWRLDFGDRGILRPRLSMRRLMATITRGGLTVDVGRQFVRWGKTDILNPTDRFAPRDYINVLSPELLAVAGVRASLQHGSETFEGVWVPLLTPSRIPLLDQRWVTAPAQPLSVPVLDAGSTFPGGAQVGARWSHVGAGIEYSLSFFNGFNSLPDIESSVAAGLPALVLTRTYPAIRAYGADAAMPTRWFTVKTEAELFTSRSAADASTVPSDDYILYVVQLERQSGEWTFVGGYVGEIVTEQRAAVSFAPDRGLARSIVGRASYTIDPRRSLTFEGAVHQTGAGLYGKAEYSEARGQHWRLSVSAVAIAGEESDFLGQYNRNSHATVTLRYSF